MILAILGPHGPASGTKTAVFTIDLVLLKGLKLVVPGNYVGLGQASVSR